MRNIKARDLRHRVTILVNQNASGQDSFGETGVSYQPTVTVWASIEPLRGRELQTAQAVRADLTHLVKMRYTGYIPPTARVQYGTRIFNLLPATNTEERNRQVTFYAVEVNP